MANGPAAAAGLKVEDAILSIDSKLIEDSRDLARTIADLPAQATVDVKVWRNKSEQSVKVKLGTYPNTAATEEGTTEPEEPNKDLGGNVDLKQLGLSVKSGPTKDVVISDVDPNSDAALKGIKEGDIVLKAGNETVSSPQDVAKAVKKAQDDGLPAVMFHIKRGGDQTVLVAIPLNKS
jgi:serine protease Do